jgi:hypothetical protein
MKIARAPALRFELESAQFVHAHFAKPLLIP